MSEKFKQIHTEMRTIVSDQGIVNIPAELDAGDRSVSVGFLSNREGIASYGIYDNNRIISIGTQRGINSEVGIKVRANDLDGDGKVSLKEILIQARLDLYNYPAVPLLDQQV